MESREHEHLPNLAAVLARDCVSYTSQHTSGALQFFACSHWSLNINGTKGTMSGQRPSGPGHYLQECGSKPVHIPLQRKQGTPLPDCGWLTDIWKRTGHWSWKCFIFKDYLRLEY